MRQSHAISIRLKEGPSPTRKPVIDSSQQANDNESSNRISTHLMELEIIYFIGLLYPMSVAVGCGGKSSHYMDAGRI